MVSCGVVSSVTWLAARRWLEPWVVWFARRSREACGRGHRRLAGGGGWRVAAASRWLGGKEAVEPGDVVVKIFWSAKNERARLQNEPQRADRRYRPRCSRYRPRCSRGAPVSLRRRSGGAPVALLWRFRGAPAALAARAPGRQGASWPISQSLIRCGHASPGGHQMLSAWPAAPAGRRCRSEGPQWLLASSATAHATTVCATAPPPAPITWGASNLFINPIRPSVRKILAKQLPILSTCASRAGFARRC